MTSALESRGDSSKLDNQIKSEIMVVIETYLSRPAIRNRLDEDSMKYMKKAVESQSYSRLPRVRSVAKDLLHKLKNPQLLPFKQVNAFEAVNRPSRPATDRKDRVYVSPRGMDGDVGTQNPYHMGQSVADSNGCSLVQNSSAGQNLGFSFHQAGEGQNALLVDRQKSHVGENLVESKQMDIPQTVSEDVKRIKLSVEKELASNDQEIAKSADFPKQISHPTQTQPDPSQKPIAQNHQILASQLQNVSAASFAFQSLQSGQTEPQVTEEYHLGASPQLRQKRDELKMKKQPNSTANLRANSPPDRELNETSDLKRGMFLIEDPLLRMTRGKGWGPNIRAKNYLKKFTGLGQFAGGGGQGGSEMHEDSMRSERLQARRETRSKQRNELQYMIGKNKNESRSNSRSVSKFGLVDETEEKKRKRRLLYISKGIDPEDVDAEGKLRTILEKVAIEEEDNKNPYIKRNANLQ